MKKQVCRIVLTIIFTALVFAVAAYNNFADEEAVNLKYNLKVGDLLTYQMKMSSRMSMAGTLLPMDGEGIRTQIVTEVSKEGVYSLHIADHDETTRAITGVGRVTMSVKRQKMRPDGRIIESSALAKDPLESVLFSAGELPSMPVRKGETWKQKLKVSGGSSLDIQWTLIGFQKVRGYDCAQLEGTFTGSIPFQDVSISAEQGELKLTHSFAVKEGFTIAAKVEMRMKLTPPPGAKEEGSFTFNFELELMKKEGLPPTKLQETVSALELAASGQDELRKRNYDNAISAFEKAIEVDLEPFRTYLYPELARAYIKAGRSYGYGPEDVLKLAGVLKKRAGNDAFSYAKLGDLYSIAQRHEEAIEAYKKALELRPKYHYFKWKLAEAYREMGDSERADQLYEQLYEEDR